MKKLALFVLCTILYTSYGQNNNPQIVIGNEENMTSWGNNHLPKTCGIKKSGDFGGISFTGRYASYTGADTWYIIYTKDGKKFSSWTDGNVFGEDGGSPNPRCAKIEGESPLDLHISVVGGKIKHNGDNGPGGLHSFGRYPSAQLMYNNIWYYGTYLLELNDRSTYMPHADWPVLQPFIGFRVSGDYGENWYDKTNPDSPLFENAHEKWIKAHNVDYNGYEVMIGAPHFVDFGVNMKYAPKDKKTGRKWAYMVAHGADAKAEIAENSWINGDNIYLLRILMPDGEDIEQNFAYMNNFANWQYFAKDGTYKPWNRDNLNEVYENIKPIVDATGFLGNVGLTYNAPLKKYFMTLSRSVKADSFNTIILESDSIDGEYKEIQYLKGFATVSYFMNIPSCFISEDGKKMWLSYSSNYGYRLSNIAGSKYAFCLREIILDDTKEATSNKYEAESMETLGTAYYQADSAASNYTVVNGISHITDGLEFYSKSSGNRLAVAVAYSRNYTQQMSVYVNDEFASKITIQPSGDDKKFQLSYAPVKISYGDKITIKIDKDDVISNRTKGEIKEDGTIENDTSYRIIGKIDYFTIEK